MPLQKNHILRELSCPVCKTSLKEDQGGETLACTGPIVHHFPIIRDIPILINDQNSVFAVHDYVDEHKREMESNDLAHGTWASQSRRSKRVWYKSWYRNFGRFLTNFTVKTDRISSRDAMRFVSDIEKPKVLLVGSGENLDAREYNSNTEVVVTDVAMGSHLDYVCDGHDLPFQDELFDLVILNAVLEHVADPYRVVEEVHRVLKASGVVYADTPFLQPIHMGPYDFTRFTATGYRRLFRDFKEIALEPVLGPGSALAYSIQYFFTSFADTRGSRSILNLIGLVVSRPFKFFDKWRLKEKSAIACAGGYGFIGQKSAIRLSDRDLVTEFSDRLHLT